MYRKLQTLTASNGTQVTVLYNTEWDEYEVRVQGSPDATYYTDSRKDAQGTALLMLHDVEAKEVCNG